MSDSRTLPLTRRRNDISTRKRTLLVTVLMLATAVATACSPSEPAPTPTPTTSSAQPSPTGGPQTPASPATPAQADCPGGGTAAVGVFRTTNPDEVAAFEAWLGCRVSVAVDFSARASWSDISNPAYLLKAWSGENRRLALGVAMLPEDESATIEAGAAGEYDRYFRQLAEGLVKEGHPDAILRVGWEFNLDGSRWFTRDADAFKQYWRRIATTMNEVPGSSFMFDWNLNNGRNPVDATRYYPGDDVVDIVGVDSYDVSGATYPYPENCDAACRLKLQTQAWEKSIFGGSRGLRFWRDFAAERGKPLSLPEWGLWDRPDGTGGGENQFYIQRMHEFIVDPRSNVAYQAYFESNGDDGAHRLMTSFRTSGDLFRRLFNP